MRLQDVHNDAQTPVICGHPSSLSQPHFGRNVIRRPTGPRVHVLLEDAGEAEVRDLQDGTEALGGVEQVLRL